MGPLLTTPVNALRVDALCTAPLPRSDERTANSTYSGPETEHLGRALVSVAKDVGQVEDFQVTYGAARNDTTGGLVGDFRNEEPVAKTASARGKGKQLLLFALRQVWPVLSPPG